MFCPICSKEVLREDWRCEGCGTDLRRVIREEYWAELGGPRRKDSSSDDRFRPQETRPVTESWRSLHKSSHRGFLFVGIGSAILAALILLLYFAFRKTPPAAPPHTVQNPPAATQTNPKPAPAPVAASPQTPAAPAPIGSASEDEIKKRIDAWRVAWQQAAEIKKIDNYGAFYADDFKYVPSGKSKSEFLRARSTEAKAAAIILIENGEPKIKVEGDLATVTFNQIYMSDRFCDAGIKTLVLARRSPKLLIISEDFTDKTPDAQINPSQLNDRIIAWRKAWEDLPIKGDATNLKSFYDPDFKSLSGRSLSSHMELKLSQAKKSTVFAIDIKGIQSSILGDRAVVSFKQTFKSDTFSDEGVKILAFHLVNNKLLITMEDFRHSKKLPALKMDKFWGQ